MLIVNYANIMSLKKIPSAPKECMTLRLCICLLILRLQVGMAKVKHLLFIELILFAGLLVK